MPLRQRAQQRQRNAMLAAQGDQMAHRFGLRLDRRQAALDIAQRESEIADVGQAHARRFDPMLRMVAIRQHPAGAADRRRTFACAGAVGGADIHRNAGDHIIGVPIGAR